MDIGTVCALSPIIRRTFLLDGGEFLSVRLVRLPSDSKDIIG